MAVRDFTIKVNGTVAYDDNSHGSFEAVGKWTGHFGKLVAQHSSVHSLEHFRRLYANRSSDVSSVFNVLAAPSTSGAVSVTPSSPSESKTVNSFVMEISGVVAYDDESKKSFIAQWVNGVVDLFPDETDSTWKDLATTVNGVRPADFLEVVLSAVADSATVA